MTIAVFLFKLITGICYQIIEETGINGQSSYSVQKVDHVGDNKIEHVPKLYLGQYQSEVKWSHLVFMGNALDVSKDGSLVFGMPYAWIGNDWNGRQLQERRTGTIAKFKTGVKNKIRVPNPLENSEYGAIWAFGTSRREATSNDPHRIDLTGVSFTKGILKFFILKSYDFIKNPKSGCSFIFPYLTSFFYTTRV